MRARGWRKVVLVTVVSNQILTAAFAYVAQQFYPGLTMLPTLAFSCVTCALVSSWLLVDARDAWRHAQKKGYVRSARTENDEGSLKVADKCPKRWLVVLHLELNPDLTGVV
ncbi:protein of unknown function [Burkholderia multivorans]